MRTVLEETLKGDAMSNIDYTIEQDNDSDLVRDLRAQIKDHASKVKALTAENDTFKATARKSTVADFLKAKNINPKVAALIPPDVEPTADGVGAWLTEFGDVFGVTPSDDPVDDGASADELDAYARVQETSHAGAPATVTGVAAAQKRWDEAAASAGSLDELIAALNSGPNR